MRQPPLLPYSHSCSRSGPLLGKLHLLPSFQLYHSTQPSRPHPCRPLLGRSQCTRHRYYLHLGMLAIQAIHHSCMAISLATRHTCLAIQQSCLVTRHICLATHHECLATKCTRLAIERQDTCRIRREATHLPIQAAHQPPTGDILGVNDWL